MTDHDYTAEATEFAKRIPEPAPRPCADVLRFPTPSERMARESRKWMQRYTVPMPPDGPEAA